jgi:glycerate kinase
MDVLLAPCVVSPVVSLVENAADTPVASSAESAAGSRLLSAWTAAAPHDAVDLCELSSGGPGFATLVGRRAETVRRGRQPQPADPVVWLAPGVVLVGTTAYVDTSAALVHGEGTSGVGEQVIAAVGAGASRIVLGLVGPGRCIVPDAGLGLLFALGVAGLEGRRLLAPGDPTAGIDETDPISPDGDTGQTGETRQADETGETRQAEDLTPDHLAGLTDALGLLARVDLVGACADDLPLLGLHGASAAAGEVGALTPADAQQLERAVGQLAHAVWSAQTASRRPDLLAGSGAAVPARLRDVTGLPGAGAGGGAGWLVALAGGRLLPGAAVHADAVDLRARAAAADLVVTTVDHLDASTFHGSGAEQAVAAAAEVGVPSVVVAGTSMMSRRESSSAGISAVYVASDRPRADGETSPVDLEDVLGRVARSWSPARTARR